MPDRSEVRLSVYAVAEVSVSNRQAGWCAPAGTAPAPAVPPGPAREGVTWQQGMPDSALRNNSSIWGGPGESYSVESGGEAVDLEFIRGLPADSVSELSTLTGDVVPGSFAAVAHLAPGLRDLSVCIDNLGADAASVIVELTALERLPSPATTLPRMAPPRGLTTMPCPPSRTSRSSKQCHY